MKSTVTRMALLAPLLAWSIAACGDATANAIDGPGGDGGIVVGDGAFDRDGFSLGDTSPTGDGSEAFCQGSGAAIPLPTGDECTSDLGPKFFRFAMCACTQASISGKLTTDSFDSSADAGAGTSASIAANGLVETNSTTSVGGYVYAGGQSVAPAPALSLSASGTILRDVQAGGNVVINGTYTIDHDLYLTGSVDITSGSLAVDGQVHIPSGQTASGVTTGGTVVAPVVVAPPCDCSSPLDIAAIVAPFQSSNDDAMAGVTVNALDNPAAPVALPCGKYYFDAVSGGNVDLQLSGRTAIFVPGDLNVLGDFTIEIAPGAELDLFVAGDFSITGTSAFGSVSAPSKVRVYIGGQTFNMSGDAGVGANLYAPNANVEFASAFEMSGAIFAKSLAFSGDFTIHYDESIISVIGCEPPGGGCMTCNDCSGTTPACKGGTCGACVTDADCCAPLQCTPSGTCVLDIP